MSRRLLLTAIAILGAVLLLTAAKQRAVRATAHLVIGPTFSNEVVRIFQDHCQNCHHPGDIGPFSLMTYADARRNAAFTKVYSELGLMPPWMPANGCGDFAEGRAMTHDEIDTITRWVNNGAPEGNPADLPPPRDFSNDWTLGQPDLVLSYPEAYTAPSQGNINRCFPLPANLTSDQYVSAIDIHPVDRTSVHHVTAFIDKSGESVRLDRGDPGPGYTCFGGPGFDITDSAAAILGVWLPGSIAKRLPEEVAYLLPARSHVVLQIHYSAHNGPPRPDKTEIGIYFAKKKPQKLLHILPLSNDTFTIPPNDPNYEVTASFTTGVAVHLWAIYPHMHLLGRKMNVQAALPTGETKCLINIDDWDFTWEGMYEYKEPIAVSPLTRFALDAFYDNSSDNYRNPNSPPQPVSWGEQTTDEMCMALLTFTIDGESIETTGKPDAKLRGQL